MSGIKTVSVPTSTVGVGQEITSQVITSTIKPEGNMYVCSHCGGKSVKAAKCLECENGYYYPVLPEIEGRKNDTGKLRYDLISPEWEEGLADILTGAPGVGGAGEYGARNWEQGINVSRAYAALRRHISAWMRGEDNDPKSGKSHLFHANACLMFLWAMPKIHPDRDDRASVMIVPTGKPV